MTRASRDADAEAECRAAAARGDPVARLLVRTVLDQGLPLYVSDPVILDRVAVILGHTRAEPTRRELPEMTMTAETIEGRPPAPDPAYVPPRVRGKFVWTETSRSLIEALCRLGGEAYDREGRATRQLKEEAHDDASFSSTAGVLGRLERAGLIRRTMNGKRTYSIKLVGYSGAVATRGASVVPAAPVVPPEVDHEPIGPGEQADALRAWVRGEGDELPDVTPAPVPLADYDELAKALLGQVLSTIDERDVKMLRLELDAVKARLGQQMDETARLRKRLDEAADTVVALKRERDGLRSQLRTSEDNLAAVIRSGSEAVAHDTQRAIAEVMRETPSPSVKLPD